MVIYVWKRYFLIADHGPEFKKNTFVAFTKKDIFLIYRLPVLDSESAGKSQTVIFRLARISSRGHNDGSRRAAKHACRLGSSKESDCLIEHVARLDVGEYEHIGIAHNRRDQTLYGAAPGIACRLDIHRTVYRHVAVAAFGGPLFQRIIR